MKVPLKNVSGLAEHALTQGNIDGLFHQCLCGWFYHSLDSVPGDLTLCVDDKPALVTVTQISRPDVQENLGYGESSGFSFDLSELDCNSVVTLSVVHSNSGFNFHSAEVKYCRELTKHYNYIRDIFLPDYYRCSYGLEHLSKEAAFQHFLQIGMYEDYNPNPWFASSFYRQHYPHKVSNGEIPLLVFLSSENSSREKTSTRFDAAHYAATYADLAGIDSLFRHFALHGIHEGRSGSEIRLPAHVFDEYEDMVDIEPDLATAAQSLETIVRYPPYNKGVYLPTLVHSRFGDRIKAVICVPFITRGGADLVSTMVLKAYQGAYGKDKTLLIVTDQPSIDVPEWIDVDSQIVCLDDECEFKSMEERVSALHITLGLLAPEKIINVNSHATWKLFQEYGMQLSSVCDLFAYLFCFDYDVKGRRIGYITSFLPKVIPYLKRVFFDNQKVIDEIQEIYGFTEYHMNSLACVYIPAASKPDKTNIADDSRRNSILWQGRLSRQKHPDILVAIASKLPGQHFVVYGSAGDSPVSSNIIDGVYPNIEYRGVYNSVDELDFSEYKLYLNTSEWDGIPTVLIQIMSVGLPIVTSIVGGISELINDDSGWIVYDFDDIEQYALRISQVMIQKNEAIQKVENAMRVINDSRSWETFYKRLESIDAFTEFACCDRKNVVPLERRSSKQPSIGKVSKIA